MAGLVEWRLINCSTLDVVLGNYFQAYSPVNASIEGRIVKSNETQQHLSSNSTSDGNHNGAMMIGWPNLVLWGLIIGGLMVVGL